MRDIPEQANNKQCPAYTEVARLKLTCSENQNGKQLRDRIKIDNAPVECSAIQLKNSRQCLTKIYK